MWNPWDQIDCYAPYPIVPASHPSRELAATKIEIDQPPEHGGARGSGGTSRSLSGVISNTSWEWENGGGVFGLSADWREAVSMPSSRSEAQIDGSTSFDLRGERCMKKNARAEVWDVLSKARKERSSDQKVAICVRSKDFGRFLPEWVAFHYAVGVDEIMIYDDDSVDNTREILEPFINAGIVKYKFFKIVHKPHQMRPLNDCLNHYLERRQKDKTSPSWLLFHDADEYMFPVHTTFTISEALQAHGDTCCLMVPRVQYGSGGYTETPRGLMLENFVTHAPERNSTLNRIPKVVVNLDPIHPELGVIEPPLPSMHRARGCTCESVRVADIRINHYIGSRGDFVDKTRRWWPGRFSLDKALTILERRDVNQVTSDTITHWACTTREVLTRVTEGVPLWNN